MHCSIGAEALSNAKPSGGGIAHWYSGRLGFSTDSFSQERWGSGVGVMKGAEKKGASVVTPYLGYFTCVAHARSWCEE